MRGRQDYGAGAINCVDARSENFDRFPSPDIAYRKIYARAMGFADPVALHGDDTLGPGAFQQFQIIEELFRVGGDFQKPLRDLADLYSRVFMTPAETVDD